jgi:hypothetical protein
MSGKQCYPRYHRLTMSSRLKRYQQEDHWHFTIGENGVWGGLVPKIRAASINISSGSG